MIDDRVPHLPLFEGLNAAALRTLTARARMRRFDAGQVLWTAGAVPRGLFVVLEGRVRVVRAPGGRQYVLHTEGPGGTLGEIPLFAGGTYPATAIAAVPTRCLVLDRDALAAVIADDPELAFRLLDRVSRRVRTLVDRLDGQAATTVEARLAALLLRRHEHAAGGAFTLGATQAEVAEELGTVREVVVRTLRGLCEKGFVQRVSRGGYRVVDAAALRRAAS